MKGPWWWVIGYADPDGWSVGVSDGVNIFWIDIQFADETGARAFAAQLSIAWEIEDALY
jgi:hypothetical protein